MGWRKVSEVLQVLEMTLSLVHVSQDSLHERAILIEKSKLVTADTQQPMFSRERPLKS